MDNAPLIFNSDHLLAMVGQNRVLARQVVTTFLDQADSLLEEADTTVKERNSKRLGQITHKLSGSARTLGAEPWGQECKSLEIKILELEEGWSQEIEDDFEALKKDFFTLKDKLVSF
jgi:HPt (histidine-containing phosphotransfer) domain-containing protein